MTRDFVAAHPWAVPGYLVVGLLALGTAPLVAARTEIGALRWWGFLTSVGGFVAVDLAPGATRSTPFWSSHVVRSWALDLPSVRELSRIGDASVDLLIAVPVGLGVVLLAGALRRAWPLAAAAVPVGCEVVQGVAPGLGRHGFLLSDLVLNEIGIALGAVLALGVLAIPRRPG